MIFFWQRLMKIRFTVPSLIVLCAAVGPPATAADRVKTVNDVVESRRPMTITGSAATA